MLTMVTYLLATDGDGQKYFSVGLTVAVAMIVLAYLFIFPAFVALRIKQPELPRPFRVPGGMGIAWLVSITSTAWALLAAVCLLWPGFGTAHPDASLPAGFEGDRATFELLVLIPVAAMLPLCVVLHALGRSSHPRSAAAALDPAPARDPAAHAPDLGADRPARRD
jgi:amino acid transporter